MTLMRPATARWLTTLIRGRLETMGSGRIGFRVVAVRAEH
jgi:hypothetical protein